MIFFSSTQASQYLPKAYNSFAGDFSKTRKYKWSEFEDLFLSSTKEKVIADIGCGNGRLHTFLSDNNISGEYIGIDIADNFLEIAKQNTDQNTQSTLHTSFQKGSFETLPLQKNSTDEIWAIASFHHIPTHSSRLKALQNMRNALTDKGSIILTLWNLWEQKKYIPHKQQAKWRAFYNPFFSIRDFLIPWGTQKIPRYYYSFSKKYITSLLAQSGFEIQNIFYSDQNRNLCIRAQKTEHQKRIHINTIPFDITTFEDALQQIFSYLKKERYHTIYTPNPEMIVACEENQEFKNILSQSDLSLADGNGIIWASGIEYLQDKHIFWKWIRGIFSLFQYAFARKTFSSPLLKPICGSDIFKSFLDISEKKSETTKPKIFLLGGAKGSAKYISSQYSSIIGYCDDKVDAKTIPSILKQINNSQANTLFVALGAPKQEVFIHKYQKELPHIRIAMGVGGSFDFISGDQTRASKLLRTFGLEWFYRLIKEPHRAQRIWTATGRFIAMILREEK